ncbi:MAG: aspartyl protease family protein [Candidatus Eremiobacteraeota bacterium]|nr:aspartyl protease family protein [Candidatus Eremiobacteraeota bacterium]
MARSSFLQAILVWGTIILLGQSQAARASAVPFTFVDNRMTIQCRINGAGPFTMIVDTGAPDVTIDSKIATQLGVRVRAAGSTIGAGNKPVLIGATQLRSLTVGETSFTDVAASVIDLSEIRTKLGFPRLDGVVGYTVMRRYAVVVDNDAHTISLDAERPPTPESATTTAFTGVIPSVAATIDGIPTTVIIDTGDRSSLTLFGPFAKEHKFYDRFPATSTIVTGYGIGGPVYGQVFTLPSLAVFGRQLSGVVTRASRQTGGVFTATQQGGSIGEGVLKRFDIIYDYPKKEIVAWPSKYFARSDRFVPPGQT